MSPYWQSWWSWWSWILNHQNPMTGCWFEFLQEKCLKTVKLTTIKAVILITIKSEITITMTCNLNHWILLPNLWTKGFHLITVSPWQPLSTVVILTTIWYLPIYAYSILHTISNRNHVDHFELLNSVNFAFSNLVSYGKKHAHTTQIWKY